MQSVVAQQITAELRHRFQTARRVLVLTGAGISAESGVPTFRGNGNATTWKGLPLEIISSRAMLEQNLPAVWDWFDYRRDVLQALEPNPGHYAIAHWQDRFAELTLVTQNVDGLHGVAGSRNVIELHGNVWRTRCISCDARFEIPKERKRPDDCFACGDRLRPDVVLFGELLPAGAFELAAQRAAECELCFIVGTSAIVYPAAAIPEIARASGAYLCEVNLERTPLSELCDVVLTGKAGEILPLLDE